jgi:dienelactone hydrolase
MAEILLFHHAGGLTEGVQQFAQTLRDAGHTVHTPDLFEGRTFDDVNDGVAFARSIGDDVLSQRASDAASAAPRATVFGGMSMGTAFATLNVIQRGASRAFFLYGVVDPGWFGASWPDGVPVQAHLTDKDPWREPEVEPTFEKFGELFVYPGDGHLFLEPGHADYDEATARTATTRVLTFLEGEPQRS